MQASLFTAATGLNSMQTGMDIIGDNVANVNTPGFKNSRPAYATLFNEVFTQATANKPVDISTQRGVQVVGTETSYTQGSFQQTNVQSDIGIQGQGFFPVSSQSGGTPDSYTRSGAFIVDNNGFLRTSDGGFVNGVGSFGTTASSNFSTPSGALNNLQNIQIPQQISTGANGATEPVKSYSIGNDGGITVTGASGTTLTVGYLAVGTFISNTGLSSVAGTKFTQTAASGTPTYNIPGQGAAGTTQSGSLEQSNADLSTQLTQMIITQRAYDFNARTLTASNEMLITAVNLKR